MPSIVENNGVTRKEILDMMNEKDSLEYQLKRLLDDLSSHRVGMDEPLVDDQGFPRNDIDVYQIRLIRSQIICTRNDLKNLMDRIEKRLSAYFTQSTPTEADNLVNGHSSLKPDL